MKLTGLRFWPARAGHWMACELCGEEAIRMTDVFFFPTADFCVLVGRIVRLSKFHFPSLTLQDMRWCIGMFGSARVKFLTKSVPDFINLTLECCLLLSKRSLLPLRGICLCLCHIATVYNCSRHKRQQPFQCTQSPSWGRTFYFPQGMSLMLEVDDSEEKLKALVGKWLVGETWRFTGCTYSWQISRWKHRWTIDWGLLWSLSFFTQHDELQLYQCEFDCDIWLKKILKRHKDGDMSDILFGRFHLVYVTRLRVVPFHSALQQEGLY